MKSEMKSKSFRDLDFCFSTSLSYFPVLLDSIESFSILRNLLGIKSAQFFCFYFPHIFEIFRKRVFLQPLLPFS